MLLPRVYRGQNSRGKQAGAGATTRVPPAAQGRAGLAAALSAHLLDRRLPSEASRQIFDIFLCSVI
jgi:hypothetical protein